MSSAPIQGYRHPGDNVITIPNVPGVQYQIDGVTVTGDVVVDKSTTVTAVPVKGVKFVDGAETEWRYVWKDSEKDLPKSARKSNEDETSTEGDES